MTRALVAAVLALLVLGTTPPAFAGQDGPDHVVLLTLPAVVWQDLVDADTPTIDRLIDEGAVAAMSVRTASRRTVPERAYLSLGAGNRANVASNDAQAHLAFPASASFLGGTAAEELERRQGRPASGEIVHLGQPLLDFRQESFDYGAEPGSFGAALRDAGVRRGVVSAADLALEPEPEDFRRAGVLGIVDHRGSVDTGTLEGLLTTDPDTPYGIRTDPDAFGDAVSRALDRARVVLVDPGETARIEEFDRYLLPQLRPAARTRALERTDALVEEVTERLGPRDLLVVAGLSTPLAIPEEHLTPLIAHGDGIEPGWLTSPTTQREGIVALTDLAPSVLDRLGVEAPSSMTGTVIDAVPGPSAGRVGELLALDEHSLFRERFTPFALGSVIALLVILTVVAAVVFLWRSPRPVVRGLTAVAFVLLAIPPAAQLVRAVEIWRLGDLLGNLSFVVVTGVLAGLAALVPGPRRRGAVVLLLFATALFGADLLVGAPLQLNGAYGYSPIVAGRFYGAGNLAHAVLYAAGILGLTGLADLRGHHRAPWWTGLGLLALPPIVGLPWFGANFGGVLAGLVAVVVTFLLARYGRIRWGWLAATAAAALLLTGAIVAFDLTRAPEVRTHLGRFAARVADGGAPALWTVVQRKIQANLSILELTRWTLTIPFAVGVMVLLLWKPRGVLRSVLPRHPVLTAGLAGALVAGVVGFAVNDSGIAITVTALATVAPFLVLMAIDTISPKSDAAPLREAPGREPSSAVPRP